MDGMSMPASPWNAGDLGATFLMWATMMAAMMLPSTLPTLRVVADANRRAMAEGAAATPPTLFVLGYLLSWTSFSALATMVQGALVSLALLTPALSASDSRLGGAMLIAAGAYQLTPWKARCLARCQNPLSLLLLRWREGGRGALAMGVRHGLFCLGCCWALMLVLFVVGVMNLTWVVALAVVVLIEKLAIGARWLPRATGIALASWGIALLIR